MARKLYRLPDQAMIAGVAAGVAQYLEMNVTLMRWIFFAIFCISGGTALIGYLVLAVLLPTPGRTSKAAGVDFGERVEDLASEMKDSGRAQRMASYTGIALVILGLWFLAGQIVPNWYALQWNIVWPVVLILIGAWIMMRGGSRK